MPYPLFTVHPLQRDRETTDDNSCQ